MEKEYMTKQGYHKLVAKKKELEQKQRDAGLAAGEAAGQDSDWHDNPAYEQAQEQIRTLARQITDLELIIRNAVIIGEDQDSAHTKEDKVAIGTSVTLLVDDEEETYFIGGSADSDPSKGIISYKSPIAEALIGHKIGETVNVTAPGSSFNVTILRIKKVL
ncbi:GreA/GreB family elongation factor [Chloroflexota bacterium]